ncbi:Poxvirus A32 protein [Popillia japonica]|uniref:Poxvirus A32 protein n=1 Tax=Popillia japonica TaxID=7064 RepID=A0AAW1L6U7_POPJA
MGGELLSQTKRIIIIGPSGSGKSTIAQEIIFGMERKSISEINYFLPNGNELEKDIQVIKELCKEAFIYFNIYRYEKDSIPNELRTHSLNIFDDAHKKTGITDLAEKIFTEGRHRQQHVIYIQQTGTFIPAGMKSSYSEIIIHKSIISDLENYININDKTINDCLENYGKTGFYTINKNGICYPTKLCDYKSFREYKNRLKAVGRNTEDDYKNNIRNLSCNS